MDLLVLDSCLSTDTGEVDLNLPGMEEMDEREAEWIPDGGGDLLGGTPAAPGGRAGPTNGNGIVCCGFRNCRFARNKGEKGDNRGLWGNRGGKRGC